jgi:hypothetical protein
LRWFLAFFWRGEEGGRRGGSGVWSIVEVGRKVTMGEDAERIERREPQKEREYVYALWEEVCGSVFSLRVCLEPVSRRGGREWREKRRNRR